MSYPDTELHCKLCYTANLAIFSKTGQTCLKFHSCFDVHAVAAFAAFGSYDVKGHNELALNIRIENNIHYIASNSDARDNEIPSDSASLSRTFLILGEMSPFPDISLNI